MVPCPLLYGVSFLFTGSFSITNKDCQQTSDICKATGTLQKLEQFLVLKLIENERIFNWIETALKNI